VAANFPIQGIAASILRLAILWFYEAGLPLLATIHDAALFEVNLADAPELIRVATAIMVRAGEQMIPGMRLKVDVSSVPLLILPGINIKPLAEGGDVRKAYELHVARARQAMLGGAA
jgi:hypothetical protein